MTPLAANRSRQLFELRIVHRAARLVVIGLEQIDVDFERSARGREGIAAIGNERAQAFAQCRSFLHGHLRFARFVRFVRFAG